MNLGSGGGLELQASCVECRCPGLTPANPGPCGLVGETGWSAQPGVALPL